MNEREKHIDRFLGEAMRNAALRNELRPVLWNLDDIVAVGKKHGYDFTRRDLEEFIRKGSLFAVLGATLLALGVGAF